MGESNGAGNIGWVRIISWSDDEYSHSRMVLLKQAIQCLGIRL